jgi:hypothetical protein
LSRGIFLELGKNYPTMGMLTMALEISRWQLRPVG